MPLALLVLAPNSFAIWAPNLTGFRMGADAKVQ